MIAATAGPAVKQTGAMTSANFTPLKVQSEVEYSAYAQQIIAMLTEAKSDLVPSLFSLARRVGLTGRRARTDIRGLIH